MDVREEILVLSLSEIGLFVRFEFGLLALRPRVVIFDVKLYSLAISVLARTGRRFSTTSYVEVQYFNYLKV